MAAVGTGLGNYTITYVDGELTVSPAADVTADDRTKTYGQTVAFAGTEFIDRPACSATDDRHDRDLDQPGRRATATSPAPVHRSPRRPPSATGLGNYTISYVDGRR